MSKASTGSSTAHLFGFAVTAKVLSALRMRLRRNRDARRLSGLDEFMLRDIGLTRADIFSADHGRITRRD